VRPQSGKTWQMRPFEPPVAEDGKQVVVMGICSIFSQQGLPSVFKGS
jgi:hypothetical protein